ncbi:glutaredoxin domain-containing cysteine-rich protein CG12206 [Senna tora]|uniref:Glutaredoxin domain-containing cysteine-rich protein CG12206 n=1 Tax=Senna tora TaxID=362788 RepID=A0A834U1U4_9FABA|nr:glutaredoxin domain-containing cysteine-rich protein CG12206 [Senna tora]
MGCASSKRIEANVGPYRPAPTSFAVFDINAIEEPWLKLNTATLAPDHQDQLDNKPPHVPTSILHKLNNMLDTTEAPQSWADLSKALDDLKPIAKAPSTSSPPAQAQTKPAPRKTSSFHTVEELEAKLNAKPNVKPSKDLRKTESMRTTTVAAAESEKTKSSESDRMEREKEGKESNYAKLRRDPLSEFPEKCPPGGEETVVIYTTSLGGVRKTFEDCNRVREVLEGHRVVYDERDVSLHGEFLKEMKELVGGEEGVRVPRVFVKGRYIGGGDEVVALNETGRLGRILNATRVERGIGRQACVGCGGARFVPCLECGGSCKVVTKQRCAHCNENGLVHCPACL